MISHHKKMYLRQLAVFRLNEIFNFNVQNIRKVQILLPLDLH